MISWPWRLTPARTTPRMTAFRPGQSPPPVSTPMRMRGILPRAPPLTRSAAMFRRGGRRASRSGLALDPKRAVGRHVERHRLAELAHEPPALLMHAPGQEPPAPAVGDGAAGVVPAGRVAKEEMVAVQPVRPEPRRGAQLMGAALGDDAAAQPDGAVVALRRAEEDPPLAAQADELRDLELAQLPRRREGRRGVPADEIGGGRV